MSDLKQVEGGVIGQSQRHLVVVSKWNEFITFRLRDGALSALERHGVKTEDITVLYVPGALELASAAKVALATNSYDSAICIGCVIRGATGHYDFVAGQSARLVSQLGYDTGLPVIFGVLTTDTIEQAIERAGTKAGNKGYEAAVAAIEMIDLYKKIRA
ncbi:MAG: 6,7-dimethyl-8-ribityllumazine synthase [Leptonema sp. (in: Bacteria)]|nr:6,7-dimethyl-8-ribityllumazine synthase [Leptonema sp. (in: bacteria)]